MIKILLCEKVFTILSYLAAKSHKFLNIISAKNIYLSELIVMQRKRDSNKIQLILLESLKLPAKKINLIILT